MHQRKTFLEIMVKKSIGIWEYVENWQKYFEKEVLVSIVDKCFTKPKLILTGTNKG